MSHAFCWLVGRCAWRLSDLCGSLIRQCCNLKDSDTISGCPWKGTANYYNIDVDGETNPDAAWHYPDPKDAASEIRGRIAFWKGVQIIE
ncbi:MAG: DUF427 domain-containing protein [Proteobacteria bacterium]|nr:DUF427 domain-containing protein [Pseudomonadota bacterium]